MTDRDDQSHIYAAYFELVQSFNLNNSEYLKVADDIATQRQRAIERAVEIHINPVLSTVRNIQIGSIFAGILALLLLCGGASLMGNSASSSEATGSGGFGLITLLISLGLGTIAIIAFAWTSSKISDLNKTKMFHVQGGPPSIPDHNA